MFSFDSGFSIVLKLRVEANQLLNNHPSVLIMFQTKCITVRMSRFKMSYHTMFILQSRIQTLCEKCKWNSIILHAAKYQKDWMITAAHLSTHTHKIYVLTQTRNIYWTWDICSRNFLLAKHNLRFINTADSKHFYRNTWSLLSSMHNIMIHTINILECLCFV